MRDRVHQFRLAFRSLMARGKKLLQSMVVFVRRLQHLLPDGRREWVKWVSHNAESFANAVKNVRERWAEDPNDRFSCLHYVLGFFAIPVPDGDAAAQDTLWG